MYFSVCSVVVAVSVDGVLFPSLYLPPQRLFLSFLCWVLLNLFIFFFFPESETSPQSDSPLLRLSSVHSVCHGISFPLGILCERAGQLIVLYRVG